MGSVGFIEIIGLLVGLALLLSVVPATLRWIWNLTMPDVFGLSEITFWQAFRLLVLSFLFFGIWTVGG